MMFPGVQRVGGDQPDVSAYANMLAASGVVGPDGAAVTEAMTFGITGGIGFLYGAFVYGDQPTMTIVGRNTSLPDTLVAPVADRLGITVESSVTGGAKTASTRLDEVLAREQPVLCLVASMLPYACQSGAAPSLVGVVGVVGVGDDLSQVLIDDRSSTAFVVRRNELDEARGALKAGKHLMMTVPPGQSVDWGRIIGPAVSAGVEGFNTPPVPQFASNVGLAGMAKLAGLLGNPAQAKSWAKIFTSGPKAAIGLTRLADCTTYDYSVSGNSRGLYADFLDEISSFIDTQDIATGFRESSLVWQQVASIARLADPSIARACAISDELDSLLRSGVRDDARVAALADEKQAAIGACELGEADAQLVYSELARLVSQIQDLEASLLADLQVAATNA